MLDQSAKMVTMHVRNARHRTNPPSCRREDDGNAQRERLVARTRNVRSARIMSKLSAKTIIGAAEL